MLILLIIGIPWAISALGTVSTDDAYVNGHVTLVAPQLVYLLCLATSLVCAGLLARAYRRSRHRLLLWCAISFFGTLNTAIDPPCASMIRFAT